jgi:hypothetical protein
MCVGVENVKDVDLSFVRLDRCLHERESACVYCACVYMCSGV